MLQSKSSVDSLSCSLVDSLLSSAKYSVISSTKHLFTLSIILVITSFLSSCCSPNTKLVLETDDYRFHTNQIIRRDSSVMFYSHTSPTDSTLVKLVVRGKDKVVVRKNR